jgi:hypothetical protein
LREENRCQRREAPRPHIRSLHIGALNNGAGKLTIVTPGSLGLDALFANNRKHRDNRLADLNGDGHLDLIANVYSCHPSFTDTCL